MSRELRFSDKKRPTTFKKTHEFIPIDAPQKVLMENLGSLNVRLNTDFPLVTNTQWGLPIQVTDFIVFYLKT
jgi:hypothetical protein